MSGGKAGLLRLRGQGLTAAVKGSGSMYGGVRVGVGPDCFCWCCVFRVGKVTGRLPLELADEVLQSLLQLFM